MDVYLNGVVLFIVISIVPTEVSMECSHHYHSHNATKCRDMEPSDEAHMLSLYEHTTYLKNRTIIRELTMENQWICASVIMK